MKKLILMMALVTGVYGLSNAQSNNKLFVKVTNIKSADGNIGVAVFNTKESFLGKPFVNATKTAMVGEMIFELEVPNGEYTISVMHDLNKNGSLDKNFMGIPSEPYGISKSGKSMFGPPSYSDALFSVSEMKTEITINID